jgi:surface antigen
MRLTKTATSAAFSICAVLFLSACAGPQDSTYEARITAPSPNDAAQPRVSTKGTQVGAVPAPRNVAASKPLQCVPYARNISGVSIRGDAWTWWQSAEGRYRRNNRPAFGSVLVLERTNHLRYGHVAVVSRILSDREILVDHANWLNRGQIHKHLPVRDVSTNNDWSVVRVWYTPGNTLGTRSYPAYGFIHPLQARVLRLQKPKMQGPDVRALQERLAHAGYYITADGVFGSNTRDVVTAYQSSKGLSDDGIAGPGTLASLGLAGDP